MMAVLNRAHNTNLWVAKYPDFVAPCVAGSDLKKLAHSPALATRLSPLKISPPATMNQPA